MEYRVLEEIISAPECDWSYSRLSIAQSSLISMAVSCLKTCNHIRTSTIVLSFTLLDGLPNYRFDSCNCHPWADPKSVHYT